jgi:hypothetical protein
VPGVTDWQRFSLLSQAASASDGGFAAASAGGYPAQTDMHGVMSWINARNRYLAAGGALVGPNRAASLSCGGFRPNSGIK